MTITVTASGISLDGPLVAGEKVAVSVSGLSFTAEDKPTLALLARFPDALLASVELAESETAGTWTGQLDTATKQTALFFATARADERRDAALELVAGRVSLARLTVPMANSALCPKPDGSPFASPVYVPVPGPPGTGGDPYDQPPEMDGEASAGVSDEYARGDHRHPTDTSRMAVSATGVDIKAGGDVGNISIAAALTQLDEDLGGKQDTISDLAAIRSGAMAGATAVQPSEFAPVEQVVSQLPSPYEILSLDAYNNIRKNGTELTVPPSVSGHQLGYAESLATTFSTSSTYAVGDYVTYEGLLYKCTTAVSTAGAWNAANWSAVTSTGELNAVKATIPAAQVQSNWNETNTSSKAFIQNKPGHIVQFQNNNNGGTDFKALTVGARDSSGVRGQPSLVVGDSSKATYPNSAVFGYGCAALDTNSFCQGWFNKVDGNSGATFGQNNYATRGSFSAGRRATSSTGDYGDGTKHQFAFTWQGKTVDTTNTPTVGDNYYHSHGEGTFNVNPEPASGSTDPATGFWIGETKLSDYVRYAFASPTPTVSGTAATVACQDRAINDFTVATGITSLTITPPAAVTGRARDFFCRVTLTDSSLPTVTLSGATIDIGATEVAGMTQGVNLLMFTEISSGHWLASRRSAS